MLVCHKKRHLWVRVDSPARPCYTPPHREARVLDRGAISENEAVSPKVCLDDTVFLQCQSASGLGIGLRRGNGAHAYKYANTCRRARLNGYAPKFVPTRLPDSFRHRPDVHQHSGIHRIPFRAR